MIALEKYTYMIQGCLHLSMRFWLLWDSQGSNIMKMERSILISPQSFLCSFVLFFLMNNVVKKNMKPLFLSWVTIFWNSFQSWDNVYDAIARRTMFGAVEAMRKHCEEHVLPCVYLSKNLRWQRSWHFFLLKRPMNFFVMEKPNIWEFILIFIFHKTTSIITITFWGPLC